MRIKAPEKAESKIILRDVAKETDISKAPAKVSEAGAKIEHSKEELPKPIKTTTRVSAPAPKLSSKEIKEREIAKAIRQASKMPETSAGRARKRTFFGELGWQRVVLAVGCAATAVFAIAYFVNLTSTDMSIKVAAMQSGIEATYPSYVPRGYTASDVTSSNGKVIINFKNGDDSFGLTEESTTWDSDALLSNYVKQVYGDDYTVVREQGLTLFMGGNWEAWINGGVLYKLTVTHGSLTKKQMKSIAVSL